MVLTRRQAVVKRGFDLLIAIPALLLCLFPMLVLAAALRLSSAGPGLFRQRRIGRQGKPFTCIKFRSMRLNSESEGTVTKRGDRRITGIGRVLRRTKLDELPQLWNVLLGRMSFVGPRPDVAGYADRLEGEQRAILTLRPGITGPATLFFRNEEELLAKATHPQRYNDEVIWPTKVRLNLEYARTWSFWRDVGYILVTVCPPLDRWLRVVPHDVDLPQP